MMHYTSFFAVVSGSILSLSTTIECFSSSSSFKSSAFLTSSKNIAPRGNGRLASDIALQVSTSPAPTKSAEEAFKEFEQSLQTEDFTSSASSTTPTTIDKESLTWQERLEMLLDPELSNTQRRILLTELLNENEDIRSSVFEALRERKIDPVLTPTGKKLQDATRAVARQISVDILPALAESLRGSSSAAEQQRRIVEELPSQLPKLGGSLLDALSTQAKKQLELLQGDIQDPSRIPERLSKQRYEVLNEARNIFSETPIGLAEPKYTVIQKGIDYEIRQYDSYKAAVTDMKKTTTSSDGTAAATTTVSIEDVTSGGAAFNAIASYIFGANDEQRTMDMTTPVTTTSTGEMRFYLEGNGNFPEPVTQEDTPLYTKGSVRLIDVPATCLAVARFTGFVTDGEVSRQKDALLAALAVDGIELDVPHGSTIPYVIFQYNPPYTIPIVRRNEIAIPVIDPTKTTEVTTLKDEWDTTN